MKVTKQYPHLTYTEHKSSYRRNFLCGLLFILAFALSYAEQAQGTVYYVSNSGHDDNEGISPVYPWRTLQRVNSAMPKLRPGDAILFERGSYFTGQINVTASGTRDNPIFFGAYGDGPYPVISGSRHIKQWTKQNGGMYNASIDTTVENVLMNSIHMTVARFPNSGFRTIASGIGDKRSGFSDPSLSQKKNFWKGANAKIRTIDWVFENRKVIRNESGNVFLEEKTIHPITKGHGYFLDNLPALLDTANEWYFRKNENAPGGVISIVPPKGVNPENAFTEASFVQFGLFSAVDVSDITITGLEFRNQTVSGIMFFGNVTRLTVSKCIFAGQLEAGISLQKPSLSLVISGCIFENITDKGVNLLSAESAEITNNIFWNIGMIPGRVREGDDFSMSAIVLLSSNRNIIAGNSIYKVGHDGINCIGSGNIIEKNVVGNVLLLLADGGGIKSYGNTSKGTVWRNNFVYNVIGNFSGVPSDRPMPSFGLYADAGCSDMTISSNTVQNVTGSGIFLYEDCYRISVSDNIIMNTPVSIKLRSDKKGLAENSFIRNELVGTGESQFAARVIATNSKPKIGSFSDNLYVFPRNPVPFRYELRSNLSEMDLQGWREYTGIADAGSRLLDGESYYHPRLFRNMNFDTVTYILESDVNYKDAFGKVYPGSVTVPPWTSKVLFADKSTASLPALEVNCSNMDFGSIPAGSLSGFSWAVVHSENLRGDLTVKCPEGYLVSSVPDRNFSRSITLRSPQGSGVTTIYFRFNPTGAARFYGFAEITSTGLKRLLKMNGSGTR